MTNDMCQTHLGITKQCSEGCVPGCVKEDCQKFACSIECLGNDTLGLPKIEEAGKKGEIGCQMTLDVC